MKYKMFGDYTVMENGDIYNAKGKKLTHTIKNGRKEIKLSFNGKRKAFISPRLVYCLFNDIDIETFDKNQCVTFKDGDKLNIHIDNLQIKFRGDLIQGDNHKAINKLNEKQVQEIKEKYFSTIQNKPINQHDKTKPYNSYRSLAREYGVKYSAIKQIVEGSCRNERNYKLKKGN